MEEVEALVASASAANVHDDDDACDDGDKENTEDAGDGDDGLVFGRVAPVAITGRGLGLTAAIGWVRTACSVWA